MYKCTLFFKYDITSSIGSIVSNTFYNTTPIKHVLVIIKIVCIGTIPCFYTSHFIIRIKCIRININGITIINKWFTPICKIIRSIPINEITTLWTHGIPVMWYIAIR